MKSFFQGEELSVSRRYEIKLPKVSWGFRVAKNYQKIQKIMKNVIDENLTLWESSTIIAQKD